MRIHKEARHNNQFIVGANIRLLVPDYGKYFCPCPDAVELRFSVGEFVECVGVDSFHGMVAAGR